MRWFPLFFIVSAALVGGAMQLCGLRSNEYPATALLIITVPAIVAPSVLFRWRKPMHPSQTSRYQAVRVRLKRSFLGKTMALEFKFTNSAYAQRYREALDSESARALQGLQDVPDPR